MPRDIRKNTSRRSLPQRERRGGMDWQPFRDRLTLLIEQAPSAAAFARACEVTPTMLNNWRFGWALPRAPEARKIAHGAGVTLDWLLDGVGHDGKPSRAPVRPNQILDDDAFAKDLATAVFARVPELRERRDLWTALNVEFIVASLARSIRQYAQLARRETERATRHHRGDWFGPLLPLFGRMNGLAERLPEIATAPDEVRYYAEQFAWVAAEADNLISRLEAQYAHEADPRAAVARPAFLARSAAATPLIDACAPSPWSQLSEELRRRVAELRAEFDMVAADVNAVRRARARTARFNAFLRLTRYDDPDLGAALNDDATYAASLWRLAAGHFRDRGLMAIASTCTQNSVLDVRPEPPISLEEFSNG